MLADLADRSTSAGSLGAGTLTSRLSLRRLVEFIADQLPRWRGHPERPPADSEVHLNAQLCSYLNGAARRSALDAIQFCAEAPDEAHRGRRLDLAVRPCGATLRVEGRRYTEFETLLPIECKRLPTPRDGHRDEREYVVGVEASTVGGIQRFKLGVHGSAHRIAVLIGYVQAGTFDHWRATINRWLAELAEADALWRGERLDPVASPSDEVARHLSVHRRDAASSATIEVQHLWIVL